MKRTLHLLWHAKSGWKNAALDDHERPLSKRGRETAKTLGRYLRREKSSQTWWSAPPPSAQRRRSRPSARKPSCERSCWKGGSTRHPSKSRGSASGRCSKAPKSVLLIGHNPALQELALELADAESHARFPAIEDRGDVIVLVERDHQLFQPRIALLDGAVVHVVLEVRNHESDGRQLREVTGERAQGKRFPWVVLRGEPRSTYPTKLLPASQGPAHRL